MSLPVVSVRHDPVGLHMVDRPHRNLRAQDPAFDMGQEE